MQMILNLTKNTVTALFPFAAVTWRDRARGMIGRSFGPAFDAMVFERCGAIHMCFMSRNLDVIFCGADNRVLKTVKSLPPWTLFCGCSGARTVVELPEGALERSKTEIGDILDWRAESVGIVQQSAGKDSGAEISLPHACPRENMEMKQ